MSTGDLFDPMGGLPNPSDPDALNQRVGEACAMAASAVGQLWAETEAAIRDCIERSATANFDCSACINSAINRHMLEANRLLTGCTNQLSTHLAMAIGRAQEYLAQCQSLVGPVVPPLPPPHEIDRGEEDDTQPPAVDDTLPDDSPGLVARFGGEITACEESLGDLVGLGGERRTPAGRLLTDKWRAGEAVIKRVGTRGCMLQTDEPTPFGPWSVQVDSAWCDCILGSVEEEPDTTDLPPADDILPPIQETPTPPPPTATPVTPPPTPPPPTSGFGEPAITTELPPGFEQPTFCEVYPNQCLTTPPGTPYPGIQTCIRLCPEDRPEPIPEDEEGRPVERQERPRPSAGTVQFAKCRIDAYESFGDTADIVQAATSWVRDWAAAIRPDAVQGMSIRSLLTANTGGVVGALVGHFGDALVNGLKRVTGFAATIAPCSNNTYQASMGGLIVGGLASQWVSPEISQALWPLRYAAYRACPTQFPTADQAAGAYLAGSIPDNVVQTWVTQNNQCWAPYERVIWGQRSKPAADAAIRLEWRGEISQAQRDRYARNLGWLDAQEWNHQAAAARPYLGPAEAIRLWSRGEYSDESRERVFRANGWTDANGSADLLRASRALEPLDVAMEMFRRELMDPFEFRAHVGGLGYFDDRQRERIMALKTVVPPASDLTRFMVRDVADESLVSKFGMDSEFEDKFAGKVKTWANHQGIEDDYMRAVWRAHWSIPSPGQLYTMYHRFSRLPEGDPGRVTLDDVETALKQADILPFWIPKLLKASERLLTRVDVRRAFNIGSLTREQVKENYQQSGYSEENAEALTKFAEKLRDRAILGEPAAKEYAAGTMDAEEASQELRASGFPQETIDQAFARLDRRWKAAVGKRCAAALQRRFMRFELTPVQARTELGNLGFRPRAVQATVDAWVCERNSKGREATAAQLCRWFTLGMIDAPTFQQRLTEAGWGITDATRIVLECGVKISLRMRKALEAQAKQDAAAAEKLKKAQEQAAKAADREAAKLEKAREQARKLKEKREQALMKAAERLAKARGWEFPAAFASVRAEFGRLTADWSFLPDERVEIVVLAAEQAARTPGADFAGLVREIATARASLEPVVPPQS